MSEMVGFRKHGNIIQEFLPKNEQLKTQEEKRILFFNLYNYYVDKDMRITKQEMIDGKSIYEVFKKKVNSISENTITKQRFINMIEFTNGTTFFNLDDMFLHLVYERIKLVNKNSKIYLYDKTIIVIDKNKNISPTLLIPSYRKVTNKSIYEKESIVSHHLKTVLKTLEETQIRQIYLVYPKHDEFKKHIQIKLTEKTKLAEDKYQVKIIPYSFSFCTRTANKLCNKKTN